MEDLDLENNPEFITDESAVSEENKMKFDIQEAHSYHMKSLKYTFYEEISFYLSTGLSVFLYGIGSKRTFLVDFASTLQNTPTLIINGYHSNCSLKHITSTLLTYLQARLKNSLNPPAIPSSLPVQSKIHLLLNNLPTTLYIVIPSFDTLLLRCPDITSFLTSLLQFQPRLLVSIDRLHSPIMLEEGFLNSFKGVFMEVNTFNADGIGTDYDVEKEYSGRLFEGTGEVGEIGVDYVLASMTKNQVEVVRVVAEFVLETGKQVGVKELYDE
jgi:hypothetical protein